MEWDWTHIKNKSRENWSPAITFPTPPAPDGVLNRFWNKHVSFYCWTLLLSELFWIICENLSCSIKKCDLPCDFGNFISCKLKSLQIAQKTLTISENNLDILMRNTKNQREFSVISVHPQTGYFQHPTNTAALQKILIEDRCGGELWNYFKILNILHEIPLRKLRKSSQ